MSEVSMNKATTTGAPEPESTGEITRRRFLGFLFGLATALGLGAFVAPLARFSYPVLKGEVFERMLVANTTDLEPLGEGVKFEYMDVPCHLIQEEDGSYAAFSMICTHLGCISRWEPERAVFHCPCHAGEFDPLGNVVAGPPPRPLDKLTLAVEGENIYVEGFAQQEG
ncbi:MAG: ubiquinol-cytochrome c reductase iron-sulfur subunit [Gaiellales bacterium]|nr:MAG: ubiquinol-cytochrome c reductase iron-sulfur subunit [Gaiellales bacterium]